MIEFVIHFLNSTILPIVHQFGAWFYVVVALLALLESTVVIGTFVPGVVILLFFGFAASQGDVSLSGVILATSIGAILGDFISYAMGRYGTGFVKENRGLLRMSHIEIGKAFFGKHGGKSVLLGRFIGPIRQIIPFIAGAIKMGYFRFIYLNVAGAFLWAITYIVIGYYFGSNWKVIDKVVSRVGLGITIVLVAVVAYAFHKRRKKKLEALRHSVVTTPDVSAVVTIEDKK